VDEARELKREKDLKSFDDYFPRHNSAVMRRLRDKDAPALVTEALAVAETPEYH